MARDRITRKIDRLLASEKGTIYKNYGGRISVCLVYPNTYNIGMSNLGFQGIYGLLNSRKDTVCERAFLPDDEDMAEYRRTGTELLSLETKRPLNRFDIVAFSVAFENDYPNILRILRLARIPFRASERKDVHPLLMMGGVCAFFNPEPVANFFDFCFIGEAEEMLPEFMDCLARAGDRDELHKKAADIQGIYIPDQYEIRYSLDGRISQRIPRGSAPGKIMRRQAGDFASGHFRHAIVTPETEFSNMRLVEAARGCPWSCRFCVTGYVYSPLRKKGHPSLNEEICSASGTTRRVGLIAPSLSDFPGLEEILAIEGVDFSITSLRASRRSAEIIRLLRNHKSVSIAPEAGTERLRKVIRKEITEKDIMDAAERILSQGISTLRLYFMVGLPTEEDEDIEGIVSLVRKIRETASTGNMTLTVSTFVPKPCTPFQWHPMERMEVIKKRLSLIKKSLRPLKGVSVFHDVPKYAYLQGLFARGDRRVSEVIEALVEKDDWQKACRETGIDCDSFLFRHRDRDEILPWDFIDGTVTKQKLWSEYLQACPAPDMKRTASGS